MFKKLIILSILILLTGCGKLMAGSILDQVKTSVNLVYSDKPVVGELCVVQAILESNLLGKPSGLASKYNNLFGIKKAGTNGIIKLPTKEFINGKMRTVLAAFGSNKTIEDSVKQHRQLMELPRYKAVMTATTFEEAAYAIYKAGYATDPKYPKKLIEIHNNIGH